MATRLYLPISGTPPLAALAVNVNWELINSLARLPCFTSKQNTALSTYTYTWAAALTQQWCWRQYQSDILAYAYDWTTADTVSMVIGKCGEAAAQTDSHLAYVVRVVSGDGTIIRGVIGLFHATSTEFPLVASAATRIHNARTDGAANFSSQVGDRIIIEIGLHGVTPSLTSAQMRFGDPSATGDFALTEGLTTDLVPWVELSRTVVFGTPPVVLVIANAAHAHTAENLALTQHQVLAIQDSGQGQAVENVSLTQHILLGIADTGQAQAADNLTLTAHEPSTQLVIQDAAQAQAADNLVLTQHNILAVQDTAQGQSAENASLAQHNSLVVQDAAQAHSADGTALTQHNILASADASQGQSAENVTLTAHAPGGAELTIQDASQGQAAENISLTQHNILLIQDAGQAQNADGLILTQHNALSIANAAQGQAADNLTLTAHEPGGAELTIQDASQGQGADIVLLTQHNVLAIQDASQAQMVEILVLCLGLVILRNLSTPAWRRVRIGARQANKISAFERTWKMRRR